MGHLNPSADIVQREENAKTEMGLLGHKGGQIESVRGWGRPLGGGGQPRTGGFQSHYRKGKLSSQSPPSSSSEASKGMSSRKIVAKKKKETKAKVPAGVEKKDSDRKGTLF